MTPDPEDRNPAASATACAPIALLTDFGTLDPYVARMKGIILGIAGHVPIVDITHEVPPQDITAGAFLLECARGDFPADTVFVAVVDPGVGAERSLVAVATDRHRFVAPDNGLLGFLAEGGEVRAAVRIESERHRVRSSGSTFHGRDILAPAAAHLARGTPLAELGPPHENLVRLDIPPACEVPGGYKGCIVHIDHFGNCVTNLRAEHIVNSRRARLGDRFVPLMRTYGEAASGAAMALIGSSGRLEIALRNGSAADHLGLRRGDTVRIAREANR